MYLIFVCAGRHSMRTNCKGKVMFVPDIEAAVEDYYRQVQIPEHIIIALRELVTAEFDRLHATARQKGHAYTAERDALRSERAKLLQAHSPAPSRSTCSPPSKTASSADRRSSTRRSSRATCSTNKRGPPGGLPGTGR